MPFLTVLGAGIPLNYLASSQEYILLMCLGGTYPPCDLAAPNMTCLSNSGATLHGEYDIRNSH